MHERREGVLFLATVVIAWGLTWPVNKLVLMTVPPLWAVTLRCAIAVVALFVLAVLFTPLALDGGGRDVVLGNAAILAGALLWAASIVHVRGHRWQSTAFELLPWEMLVATMILVPVSLIFEGVPTLPWTPQ